MKIIFSCIILLLISYIAAFSQEVPLYSVYELDFKGTTYKTTDNPVSEIELLTSWQHDSSRQIVQIYGFYDGDGLGGKSGNIFKVRFCPTKTGKWTLIRSQSNDRKLNQQHQGFSLNAVSSDHPGFWLVDTDSPGQRWYRRSNGSHSYIIGNTMYSFHSEYLQDEATGGNIKDDILNNSEYFKKVRVGITGDRYPNPGSKPFLEENGNPTDDGNYSSRPNPEWFHNRVDLSVKTAYDEDLIIDLILNGPDTEESRSVLKASKNKYDPTPFLKYMAARYGSYPNVWICLSNEYDIKKPVYGFDEMAALGKSIQNFLPYHTPVSVHGVRHWRDEVNTPVPWYDHVIVQSKLKTVEESADQIQFNYLLGGSSQPVINDELAYEGEGDGWSEGDVVEAMLGALLGGGYGSTGYKPANKEGHYFTGYFNATEHKAADNLKWFREKVDQHISFWKMVPVFFTSKENWELNIFWSRDIFNFRMLARPDHEYLIGGGANNQPVTADLPEGKWNVRSYDLITMEEKTLAEEISGVFQFKFSGSRAELIHFKRLDF